MREMSKSQGICTVCDSTPTCTFRNGRVLLQCERFEPLEKPPVRATIEDFLTASNLRVKTIVEVEESKQFTGLCKNCESRETCNFSKTLGGVWHCEEYQ